MLAIVTALHCEAAPIISMCGLKKDLSFHPFPLFHSNHITLIESGPGKLKSAVACTALLNYLGKESVSGVINFGTAASNPERSIGSIWLIHAIRDVATLKGYHPDILFAHSLNEASLETHDKPVLYDNPSISLFDMEGSGFFEAASTFLSPDRISCVKIVSDHPGHELPNAKSVKSLIETNIHDLLSFFGTFQVFCSCGSSKTDHTTSLHTALSMLYNLNSTQAAHLKHVLLAKKENNGAKKIPLDIKAVIIKSLTFSDLLKLLNNS